MWLAVLTLFAFGLAGFALARRFVPTGEGPAVQAVASATIAVAFATLMTRALLAVGWFRLPVVLALTCAVALGARLSRRRDPPSISAAASFPWRETWSGADRAAALPLLVGMAALGLAVAAAGYMPIWAWDATGYHLPLVNYLVQTGSSAAVPVDMPYLSTYPRNAELLFALMRLALPDDTWIDAGQIPLAVVGAGTIAALASRWGARPAPAVAAGALWLAVPGVFLQLPSGYVDVCVATFVLVAVYWILSPASPASITLAGVAIGVHLGSKPSAPLASLLLFALLVARARRAGRGRWVLAAAAAAFVLGAPDYVVNLWRFGNPLWPVAIEIGPIRLPGRETVGDLLSSGAAAPRVEGALWWRIWRSWTSFRAVPAFDMRLGGFGSLAVLIAIPGALVAIRRTPDRIAVVLVLIASLLGPDPATARFILAFPALCLALTAAAASRLRGPSFVAGVMLATVIAALDLRHATPGLAGEGPPLHRYPSMSSEERLRAVGPAGRPDRWIELRRSLAPGEAIAFDASFDTSYLLWRRGLQNRVVFVSEAASPREVLSLLLRERVRYIVAEPGSAAGALVTDRTRCFRRLFDCRAQPCAVFEVQATSCLKGGA